MRALLCGALALSSSLFAGSPDVYVDESDYQVEVPDSVFGDFDTDVTLTATGGIADADSVGSGYSEADASAAAIAIDGSVEQDGPDAPILSATFDLTATGGEATARSNLNAEAVAAGFVSGVDYVDGDFTGSITGQATGGAAAATDAQNANAYAGAGAFGHSGFSGESTGSIDVTAEGGEATAGHSFSSGLIGADDIESVPSEGYSDSAYADASALAVGSGSRKRRILRDAIESDPIEGPQLLTGSYDAVATGGDATASGLGYAEADASAAAASIVLDEVFYGEIDAEVSATATGGSADAESDLSMRTLADASAGAYAVSGVNLIEGTVAGVLNANATGGDASARSSVDNTLADATAEAIGLGFEEGGFGMVQDAIEGFDPIFEVFEGNEIFGDVTADITAVARGGEASRLGGLGAMTLDAIEGELDEYVYDGALADAYAAGIDYIASIYGVVSGSISASAYGGDAVASASYSGGLEDEIESDQFLGSAYASASAEAVGIAGFEDYDYNDFDAIEGDDFESELSIYDEVSSDITAHAEGGHALAFASSEVGGMVSAYAVATGIDGDVLLRVLRPEDAIESEEDFEFPTALSGSFNVSAVGGSAFLTYGGFRVALPINNADTIEGDFYGFNLVDASGDAFAVDGDVYGSVSADFDVNAAGGLAYVQASFNGAPSDYVLLAYADAAGVYGGVEGDFSGEMTVNATGGTAILEATDFGLDLDDIEGDGPLDEYSFVDASAIATGIGDGYFAIEGDVSGPITVNATGGTIAVIYENYNVNDPLEGDEIGEGILLPESTYNVYAQAIALNGSMYSDEVSGALTATAVGGTVVFQEDDFRDTDSVESEGGHYSVSADALAAGISGSEIYANISGGITATATPGVYGYSEGFLVDDEVLGDDDSDLDSYPTPEIPEMEYGYAANGYAFGVIASSNLDNVGDNVDGDIEGIPYGSSMEISISSAVHAIVLQPEVSEEPFDAVVESGEFPGSRNAYAAAVYGGSMNDYVVLEAGADILGDINLNGGDNELYVFGDTIMLGNILSSSDERVEYGLDIYNGFGTVDFDIVSGLFTPVGTVNVSDLYDSIEIGEGGGLAPLISRDEELSSVLNVFGEEAGVNFAEGSIVRPTFNGLEDWSDFEDGEQFLIVSTTGLIDMANAIADGSLSPFEITLVKEGGMIVPPDEIEALILAGEDLFVQIGDVKTPEGGQSPGAPQTTQAVSQSSQAVMIDISKRAAILRSLLRGSVASTGELPEGAAGPDAERMTSGEWLSYFSAFGNIGRQDTQDGRVGFEYDTYGFVVGQEKLVGDQLIVGIAGAYSETEVDGLNGNSGGETDLYSGVVYGNWFTDTWYAEGGLTYGHASTDTKRVDIANVTYTGDYDSNLYGTWFEVGYTTTYEGLEAEPYARASYVYGDHEGFTDSGAGPNSLKTKDTDTSNFKTELGLRLTEEWVFENKSRFLLGFKAAWSHEWADQSVRLDAEYLGAKLNIRSPEADRAALILGINGEWRCEDGWSVGFQYEPSIAGNWYNHAFSGTVRYNW